MPIQRIMIHCLPTGTADKSKCKINVTPPDQALHRSAGDEAQWDISPPDRTFRVIFDKPERSPFDDAEFDNAKNRSGQIVAVLETDEPEKRFPYTVYVDGCDPLDPGIIIRP